MTEHSISLLAFAKINLHLQVTGRRADGYHNISSLMQSVIDDEQLPGNTIITHPEGVDLLPSNIELSGMETGLFNVMSREYVLKNAIDGMKKNYDYILIDCSAAVKNSSLRIDTKTGSLSTTGTVTVPQNHHHGK